MVFSSVIFVFFFLPACLLLYFAVPGIRAKNAVLLLFSLVFYAWGEPVYIVLMLLSVLMNYAFGRYMERIPGWKKGILAAAVFLNLAVLGFFKYYNFIAGTWNSIVGSAAALPILDKITLPSLTFGAAFPFIGVTMRTIPFTLPIGISFYTFQTMSYSIDVYRREAPVQKNIISFGTYVALFPQLIAGPIVRYRDVAEQLIHRRETLAMFTKGVKLFCVGLAKKVLLADQLAKLSESVINTEGNGFLGTWIGIIGFSLQLYFDFSGYSDMACGLGNMLGFEFLKNFNYPYISRSITDFWRRWHISLSTWFKEYVYIPLGGNRKGVRRQIINLLIVWGLTGLWHGAAYNFIFWGLYYGGLLILEKFVLKRYLDNLPSALQHVYTMFIVLIGWGLFYFTDTGELFTFLGNLFNFGRGLVGSQTLNTILSYLPMLIVAGVASTPLAANLYQKVAAKRYIWIAETAFCAAVLFLSTASLVNQSYNPFLYFRF